MDAMLPGIAPPHTHTRVQTRLSKFTGAASISSADYYGDGRGAGSASMMGRDSNSGGGDLDVSAADLVNRLSMQARQDLAQAGAVVSSVAGKLGSLAKGLMSELQRS